MKDLKLLTGFPQGKALIASTTNPIINGPRPTKKIRIDNHATPSLKSVVIHYGVISKVKIVKDC